MILHIEHKTHYRYSQPVSEAYLELRLTPVATAGVKILEHNIRLEPKSQLSSYTDWLGNCVHFCAMVTKHEQLLITNQLTVQTSGVRPPEEALELTVAETRQLFNSQLEEVYDYLLPTAAVPVGGVARKWSARFFSLHSRFGDSLRRLNTAIYKHFQYLPGSTSVHTPLEKVWRQRAGVCQDFAHVMLSVLRTSGIPCRYVCGYIEDAPPVDAPEEKRCLVGSAATHAWVEVLLPGGFWFGLDPTNNCLVAEQHVPVSRGRDFREAAPVLGTFKTSGSQKMKVSVRVRRLSMGSAAASDPV